MPQPYWSVGATWQTGLRSTGVNASYTLWGEQPVSHGQVWH